MPPRREDRIRNSTRPLPGGTPAKSSTGSIVCAGDSPGLPSAVPSALAGGGKGTVRSAFALAACAATGFWIAWNGTWLSAGRVPPSILHHFTGLPVATTGFTRSLGAAVEGRWADSLAWNPFTAAFLALLAASGWFLARALRERRPLLLPAPVARAWCAVIGAAWLVKGVQGPRWW